MKSNVQWRPGKPEGWKWSVRLDGKMRDDIRRLCEIRNLNQVARIAVRPASAVQSGNWRGLDTQVLFPPRARRYLPRALACSFSANLPETDRSSSLMALSPLMQAH
ncbi:hypothetical protein J6590_042066 [Homalodisca vitripennis]|nr:hypothetical protein J6590_042066 [Homalodisca vitripennis]